jgi:hypothetical protein
MRPGNRYDRERGIGRTLGRTRALRNGPGRRLPSLQASARPLSGGFYPALRRGPSRNRAAQASALHGLPRPPGQPARVLALNLVDRALATLLHWSGKLHQALMCKLYSTKTHRADLARKFRLSDNRMAAFDPLPAISPGRMARSSSKAPTASASSTDKCREWHRGLGGHLALERKLWFHPFASSIPAWAPESQ